MNDDAPLLDRNRLTPDRRALADQWRGLVHHLVRRYPSYGIDYAELVGAGNVGLCIAAARFDPAREATFSTYAAFWIRCMLHDFVVGNWSQFGGKHNSAKGVLFFRARRELEALTRDLGESAALDTIAKRYRISPAALAMVFSRGSTLDNHAETDSHWRERIPQLVTSETPEDMAERSDPARQKLVRDALAELPPRSAEIVRRRLMAEDPEPLHVIGAAYGITAERVRQLERLAIAQLQARLQELEE